MSDRWAQSFALIIIAFASTGSLESIWNNQPLVVLWTKVVFRVSPLFGIRINFGEGCGGLTEKSNLSGKHCTWFLASVWFANDVQWFWIWAVLISRSLILERAMVAVLNLFHLEFPLNHGCYANWNRWYIHRLNRFSLRHIHLLCIKGDTNCRCRLVDEWYRVYTSKGSHPHRYWSGVNCWF